MKQTAKVLCWCNNCNKKWYIEVTDLQSGIDQGIYYGNEKTGFWEAESCCDECLAKMRQEISGESVD